MTGKQKKPGGQQPTPEQLQAEQMQPRQQMADDGSAGGATNFGNIDPVDGENPDEMGGG